MQAAGCSAIRHSTESREQQETQRNEKRKGSGHWGLGGTPVLRISFGSPNDIVPFGLRLVREHENVPSQSKRDRRAKKGEASTKSVSSLTKSVSSLSELYSESMVEVRLFTNRTPVVFKISEAALLCWSRKPHYSWSR
jgi:hypothetical protein